VEVWVLLLEWSCSNEGVIRSGTVGAANVLLLLLILLSYWSKAEIELFFYKNYLVTRSTYLLFRE
jgi:hypothetical protein